MEWRLLEGDHQPGDDRDLAGRTLPRRAGHWFSASWLHGKLLLVLVLSGVHGFFSRCVRISPSIAICVARNSTV